MQLVSGHLRDAEREIRRVFVGNAQRNRVFAVAKRQNLVGKNRLAFVSQQAQAVRRPRKERDVGRVADFELLGVGDEAEVNFVLFAGNKKRGFAGNRMIKTVAAGGADDVIAALLKSNHRAAAAVVARRDSLLGDFHLRRLAARRRLFFQHEQRHRLRLRLSGGIGRLDLDLDVFARQINAANRLHLARKAPRRQPDRLAGLNVFVVELGGQRDGLAFGEIAGAEGKRNFAVRAGHAGERFHARERVADGLFPRRFAVIVGGADYAGDGFAAKIDVAIGFNRQFELFQLVLLYAERAGIALRVAARDEHPVFAGRRGGAEAEIERERAEFGQRRLILKHRRAL